jgi:hypothetical protein
MFESLIPPEWAAQIRQLQPGEFWIATLIVLLLATAAFYGLFRFFHRARLMEDIPTSRIRSAAQGYVELDGTAELMEGEPIIAPLTGQRCTWFSYKIEERDEHSGGKGGHSRWNTIDSGTSDNLFLIKDETGECVIDPEGAEVTPSVKNSWYGNSPGWSAGLPSSKSLFSTGRYRYTEKRIQPADPLYAIGLFRTLGGSQELPNTREEIRHLLNLWKRDQPGLLQRFDANGDGQIDVKEWEAVRNAARKQVQKEQRERFHRPVHHIMTRPEDRQHPYILSVLPQEHIVARMKIYAGLSLTGFLISGAVATWLLTVRLVA